MRISSKLARTSLGLEPKSKYYIIPEGDNTEIQYFCGVRDNSTDLNIKPLIEIIPIENETSEHGQSHPKWKINNFERDLKSGKFTYDMEIDKVCFVIDRDPQNLSESQLDEFINKCRDNGYEVYISNPTFEVFLIMHDDRVLSLNRQEMLENRRNSRRGKRFLEIKLFEFFQCNKKNLNFQKFKSNIKKAIINEKQFCEDIESLKNNLGSNVGKLLDNMIDK